MTIARFEAFKVVEYEQRCQMTKHLRLLIADPPVCSYHTCVLYRFRYIITYTFSCFLPRNAIALARYALALQPTGMSVM